MNLLENENFKKYIKNASLGFLAIFIYFFLYSSGLSIYILKYFDINYNELPLILKTIYLTIFETIIICLILLVFNKKITKDFKDIIKNHKQYFKKYFKFYLLALGIMILSNSIIITFFTNGGIASNEETVRDIFKKAPIYMFFSSVIFAPLVEELIFRQSIRNIIPGKLIFILISGLVFGGLHIIGGLNNPIQLLYLIPYCSLGFAFAYILADSDNIFISISLHCMHNGLILALQFLGLFFQ